MNLLKFIPVQEVPNIKIKFVLYLLTDIIDTSLIKTQDKLVWNLIRRFWVLFTWFNSCLKFAQCKMTSFIITRSCLMTCLCCRNCGCTSAVNMRQRTRRNRVDIENHTHNSSAKFIMVGITSGWKRRFLHLDCIGHYRWRHTHTIRKRQAVTCWQMSSPSARESSQSFSNILCQQFWLFLEQAHG